MCAVQRTAAGVTANKRVAKKRTPQCQTILHGAQVRGLNFVEIRETRMRQQQRSQIVPDRQRCNTNRAPYVAHGLQTRCKKTRAEPCRQLLDEVDGQRIAATRDIPVVLRRDLLKQRCQKTEPRCQQQESSGMNMSPNKVGRSDPCQGAC